MCLISILEWDDLEFVYVRSGFLIAFSGILGEFLKSKKLILFGFIVLNVMYLDVVVLMKRNIEKSQPMIELSSV